MWICLGWQRSIYKYDKNDELWIESYTDLINIYVKDENQKLQVFERGSVYLASKYPKLFKVNKEPESRGIRAKLAEKKLSIFWLF